MKKILAFLMCFIFVFVAASCKDDHENKQRLDGLFDEKDKTVTDEKPQGGNTEDTVKKEESTDGENEEVKYELPESDRQMIVNQYRVAEDFYYDMQNQNFELDNMDTVTLMDNGYETVYHRVIISGVNSVAGLKAAYSFYFTEDFIDSLDFSAYREENGKLYCAELAGSISVPEYNLTVETTDENNAVLVRKQGANTQRIPAVRSADTWLFSGVGIR